jgi:NADH:ubiquinone oxidoreductase, Na(+)-translocating, C subunit
MKRDSNSYIFLYSIVMVVIVAVLLSLVSSGLKPAQQENIKMEKRIDILKSIGLGEALDGAGQEAVKEAFAKYIKQELVVNDAGKTVDGSPAFDIDLRGELGKTPAERKLPVFVATLDDGAQKYIFPLAGQGLWGQIWGYISVSADMNTVYGASFAHKSETPGLGADITTTGFQNRFKGKKLFEGANFVSVAVKKSGNTADNPHAIDAISGATLTSDGVANMLLNSLTAYKSFMESKKKEGAR